MLGVDLVWNIIRCTCRSDPHQVVCLATSMYCPSREAPVGAALRR